MLELLVTLAVLAVLLAVGTPAYRNFSLNLRLEAATSRLVSDLRFARQAAVDGGGRVALCPGDARSGCRATPDWQFGWILFRDENGDRAWQADEELLRASPLLQGITARASAARRVLSFFPNGSAPGSNVTVWFCDARGPAEGRQVRLGLSGRIRSTRARDGGPQGC